MPITLDDFKEGGSLRNFVTQVGLLGKIGKPGVNQGDLLTTLINSVTMVGAYTDSNEDGTITTADSVSDKFSNKEDESDEGDDAENENTEGGSTVVDNNDNSSTEGGSTEGGSTVVDNNDNNSTESGENTEPQSPSVDPNPTEQTEPTEPTEPTDGGQQ